MMGERENEIMDVLKLIESTNEYDDINIARIRL